MFVQWLWRVWKWLLRWFTGHCELERACYQRHQPHQLALRIGNAYSQGYSYSFAKFFRGKFKEVTSSGKELMFVMVWLAW